MRVTRTERGWVGHFICANTCLFRRNTLLECCNIKIVVSTVGLQSNPFYCNSKYPEWNTDRFTTIGHNRYFETMAFHSVTTDTRYHDIDVSRQISFDSPWAIPDVDADDKANDMHEEVVKELSTKLEKGKMMDE